MKHELPIRIYYEDTDAGGIMYHASHIRFCERGRTEFLRDGGWTNSEIAETLGVLFVVRHMDVNYLKPCYLDDMLKLKTSVIKVKNTSFIMKHDLYRDEELVFTMDVVLACITKSANLVKIPEDIRNTLQAGI
ncbi:MAG: YbgC/FadM family acyl-CoA thioesterase [Alphaproteobacteria bacterium]|nr:YbgC/FadM family acyl-CoA thioesterase [Alphaproteobacteria bacterium]